jgi:hypothetical protein
MLTRTLLIYQNQYKINYKIYPKVCQFILLNFWFFADLGSVICTFTIKKHDLEIPIIFVSWRGRNSFRPFVSHSSRKFYFSLCNIEPLTISKCIHVKTSFFYGLSFSVL